jgi:superfamily I DNA and/or RNA helicase
MGKVSHQTEPESLIPLVKGCQRAVFIGDHAQARAKVRKHAVIADFDISLFERHYNMPHMPGVAKVMLGTQYRMYPDICDFVSREFYRYELQSGEFNLILHPSRFPWPENKRMVLLQCGAAENLGYKSKSNQGQVELCQKIYAQLRTPAYASQNVPANQIARPVKIVILTPYTRTKHMLKNAIPGSEVYTVDEYQNLVADIVVFVTVRCSPHLDIGCLEDKRMVNMVITAAKAGFVLIDDKTTWTSMREGSHDAESKVMWVRLLESCVHIKL